MKFYLFTILFFVSMLTFGQTKKLENIFSEKSTLKDTIFKLKSIDNTSVDIPVTFISGAHNGPTFTIIAGIHGMEYPTILSLFDLKKEIDPKKLHGNLIIIPVVNVTAFYTRTPFLNPIDKLNLNRVFLGNAKGTITEVMADFFTNEIYPVTDVLLDMHGGDVSEDLIPFIWYYDNKEYTDQTKLAARLTEISGFDKVVSYPYILPENNQAMYAFKQAVKQGIPALSIEIGKLGNSEKAEVSFTKDAIYRMLTELKMYENKSVEPANAVKSRLTKQAYVSVPVQGIFYSEFKAGDHVKKDQEIGYITDIFGNKLKNITAPESGIILYKVGTPPVNVGETLFCIAS